MRFKIVESFTLHACALQFQWADQLSCAWYHWKGKLLFFQLAYSQTSQVSKSSSKLSYFRFSPILEGSNLTTKVCPCLSEEVRLEKESSSQSQEAFSLFSSSLRTFLLKSPGDLSEQRKDEAQLEIEPQLALWICQWPWVANLQAQYRVERAFFCFLFCWRCLWSSPNWAPKTVPLQTVCLFPHSNETDWRP